MSTADQTYPIRIEAQPIALFETPVAYCRIKEGDRLLNDLERTIKQKRSESEGLKRSNIGSWHSDTDMLKWGGAAARKLAETAISVARKMSHFQEGGADDFDWFVRMWANVTPGGGMNAIHSHPGNLWAAVIYLDLGGAEEDQSLGGSLYLEDPRFPMAAMRDASFRLMSGNGQPQQYEVDLKLARGNLLVFPAWLRHGVRPYTGAGERVSIALNIDAQRKRG